MKPQKGDTLMEMITSTAEDYLKVIWSALEWGGVPATVKQLADRFGTTPAAASNTVKRLVGQGLLVHEPYGPILLTPTGERLAVMMVRRHRLLETYLVDQLGYSWDEVHDEAENLEHAVSDLMIDRIDDLLGNPLVDPHGDPIPTKAGHVTYPAGAQRVSTAEPGEYLVTRICDGSSELLEWFDSTGIGTGARLTVTQRLDVSTRVVINGQEVHIPLDAGDAIVVLKS